ncbi:hypothetical protein Pan153_56510 [Gimesia panareensis]|uniref:Uncharacterized protein n=1 Tax=Gimesia panareensis TaxID=2527978 RepID=A0A518FXI7_9PLAN|nr:hypothetical protein [Gimesia panareensis]QDV20970.1 hypothetical protein Pan153_56510 [Gimesia panareensis]
MQRFIRTSILGPLVVCGFLTVVFAANPATTDNSGTQSNQFYMYTGALQVQDSGVVKIPSRYRWSVETSLRGYDLSGKPLPDRRIMLRLHDPNQNFTALTAQMDLATATKLHHELGEIIIKKLQNPDYQYRPQLYRKDQIPTKRIIGIDASGTAIIEDAD